MKEWFKKNGLTGILFLFIAAVFIALAINEDRKPKPILKDYKDGIQNHLIWNIKGECYFVRPNDDITVYLIRVQDCDKK